MANNSYASLFALPDEKEYYANDPWYVAGSKTLGMRVDPSIYQNNQEALLYPILQGLAGGAMQGYGEQSSYQQALEDMGPVYQRVTGEEYNPNAGFGPVASGDTYADMLQDGEIQPSIKQMKGDLLLALSDRENREEREFEAAKRNAELRDKQDFEKFKFNLESSPEAMASKAKAKGQEKASELKAEADFIGYNPKKEDATDALRKEFSALPEVKNYAQVEKAASVLNEATKDKSAVTDQELVRYSILLIEPGMAVREGEQAAVANSQSLPEAWKGQLRKALVGESALSDDTRAGLKRLAERAYIGQKDQYDRALTFYQSQAKQKGIDPDRISYMGESSELSDVFKTGIPEGAQPTNRTSGGKPVYKLPDGRMWTP